MEVTLNGGEFYMLYFILFFFFGLCCLVGDFDSQFQCRQCQDLLENNLAHKRPIEGLSPFYISITRERVVYLNITCSSYWKEEFGG